MVDRQGLLTPKQVARAIGVSEASVKRWCDGGIIETTRTAGGHRRLEPESVKAFLRESGHTVIHPEVLGLPSTSGVTDRVLARCRAVFAASLSAGQRVAASQTLEELASSGHAVATIADRIIVGALAELTEPYQRKRASTICLRVLHDLGSSLSPPKRTAPVGFVAAIDGADADVSIAIAGLVLQSAGWVVDVLGTQLPFATLKDAIRSGSPRALFVHVPMVRDEQQLRREFMNLRRVAGNRNSEIVGLPGPAIREFSALLTTADSYEALHRASKKLGRR